MECVVSWRCMVQLVYELPPPLLSSSLSAGCLALPQLLHLRSVMVQRQVSDIWSRDELPCEVNLGWERRYHSVFTCPILRQQTSGLQRCACVCVCIMYTMVCLCVLDGNPPVRLLCGHAISRDAMKKLISQSRRYTHTQTNIHTNTLIHAVVSSVPTVPLRCWRVKYKK